MAPLIPGASRYGRRQDVPRVFRINAALYVWRTAFVRREQETWMNGRHRLLEIPERRALHIDEPWDLELAELLLSTGALELPWLER